MGLEKYVLLLMDTRKMKIYKIYLSVDKITINL